MGSTQPYHDPSFLKEVWGLFAVGCFIITLRFIVRLRAVGIKGFQGDDYMTMAVLACYTVDAITVDLCYRYGTNVDFTPEALRNMSEEDQNKVIFGSRMQLLAWYTYTGLVWGLKATMLFFFNRLTFGLKQQVLVKYLAWAVVATYLATFLTVTFGCFPTQRNWQVVPYPGLTCTFKPQNFYVCTILNVITDAAILAIPLPLMWALQVSFKKKIALMLLLSSGVFVISAAIIRIVMTLVANPSGLTINRWGVRETIAGIIAVNIPIIRPVFTKCFWTKNFPPSSQKGSSKPTNTANTGGAEGRSRLRQAFSRQMDAYEMHDDAFSQVRSTHSRTEKKHPTETEVAELDSNSDLQHPTNRSSEDLVVQRPAQRRPSTSEQDPDLEMGPSTPPKLDVMVEQTYQSTRTTAPRSPNAHTASWAVREGEGWSGPWPGRTGFGNRVTIEASRKGSEA